MSNLESNKEQWHAARRTGIGGSDAAAVLGLSRYRTPYQVYLEKIGEADPQDETWEMSRGKALEPLLRQHYADTTGRTVFLPKEAMRSDKYPFMTYNPDGLSDDGRLQEFKTAAYGREWGEVGSDEIPQEYLLQVQHGMIVTGLQITDVTVSIAGNAPRYFVVEADRELQQMIIDREHEFWGMVERREEPAPISNDDVAHKWSKVDGGSVMANEGIAAAFLDLRLTRQQIADLEKQKESLEVYIKDFMGASENLLGSGGLPIATWKQQAGAKRIDADFLRKSFPEAAAAATKQGEPTRRFLLK